MMPVYRDYEIRINFNELVETRIPVCNQIHPDHCLTEEQVDHIAHACRTQVTLDSIYQQVDQIIWEFCDAAGLEDECEAIDYEPPAYGDIQPKPGREAELTRLEKEAKQRKKNAAEFEMVDLEGGAWTIQVPRRKQ